MLYAREPGSTHDQFVHAPALIALRSCLLLFVCNTHYFQGANDLRQRIIHFFAYHDMDESGECSVAELRSALAPLMEGVPFHVMAALLDRYDANGDGSVGSCLAPRRDHSIHSVTCSNQTEGQAQIVCIYPKLIFYPIYSNFKYVTFWLCRYLLARLRIGSC